MHKPTEELVDEIARHLELGHSYETTAPAWDADDIADVRAAGELAGRRLGCNVRTFKRDLGNCQVNVLVVSGEGLTG